MEQLTVGEVVRAVGGTLLGAFTDENAPVDGVGTDSRTIRPGELFVPLTGERFDGHAYINKALEQGAAGCFTARERESYLPGKFYIKVASPLRALRDLAAYYRTKFPIPLIGVTGSVGKTTTKDMVAAVLSTKYKVLKTEGNLNSREGMPLMLLRLDRSHEIAVIEMGMSQAGEIEYLARAACPDMAIITNIGDAHIENLGSRENILKAKCEIFRYLKLEGVAVLDGDDELLADVAGTLPFETLTCGEGENCSFRARDIRGGEGVLEFTAHTPEGPLALSVPAPGRHMIYPALFAAAVGRRFGLTPEQICAGIAQFRPTKMRMNVLRRGNNIAILDDAYNANPQSMRAALGVLSDSRSSYKMAVLGDMFELGSLAPMLHAGVGEYAGRCGVDCLVAVGELAVHIADAAERAGVPAVFRCPDKGSAIPVLKQQLRPDCAVLVKASRGMAMEELVDYLKQITTEE
ncbi:MAG: UDP-N-acetylmuramoyl-tripeptide--D-alanyl-D-alanine ligase [Oscillospiraceae bacterium]|nr:UDP-N-acetylmuramoyl-tripeptide--D-alanyl-D-alanine ligase [Oscillospiraceae bacterium]